MNPAIQNILNETANRRGVDISGIWQWIPMPKSPSLLPEVGSVPADMNPQPSIPMDIGVGDMLDSSLPIKWNTIEPGMPLVSVDETFMKIEGDLPVMSPVELLDLIQRILATQVQ